MGSVRALGCLVPLALASCASLPPPTPFRKGDGPKPVRSVDLLIGQRKVGSDDWDGVDEPIAAGLETWWHRPGEPLAWELTAQYGAADESIAPSGKRTGRVAELSGGLRYLFGPLAKTFHPYIAGGGSLLWAQLEQDAFGIGSFDDDAWDVGVYGRAGIYAHLTEDMRLGLDLRTLQEEWLSEGTFDLDYVQLALTIGSSW